MESNSFFSLQRFFLLMRNDLLLNYKKYLLTIVGALIVGYVILYFQMPTKEHSMDFSDKRYLPIFMTFIFALGAFVGMSFPALNSKSTTISYLLMPSSSFEKFLSQFLIRIVAGTALFLAIFWIDAYLARETALLVLRKFENIPQIDSFSYHTLINNFGNNGDVIARNVVIFLFLSIGIYLFSVRIYFRKVAMIKSALSLSFSIFLIIILLYIFSSIFYPETKGMDFHLNEYKVYLKYSNFDIWLFTMFSLPWLFFLPLGYFKLKEKQV